MYPIYFSQLRITCLDCSIILWYSNSIIHLLELVFHMGFLSELKLTIKIVINKNFLFLRSLNWAISQFSVSWPLQECDCHRHQPKTTRVRTKASERRLPPYPFHYVSKRTRPRRGSTINR